MGVFIFKETINKIQSILNKTEDFYVVTKTSNDTGMIMDCNGSRFLVELHQIVEPQKDIFEDVKKYL